MHQSNFANATLHATANAANGRRMRQALHTIKPRREPTHAGYREHDSTEPEHRTRVVLLMRTTDERADMPELVENTRVRSFYAFDLALTPKCLLQRASEQDPFADGIEILDGCVLQAILYVSADRAESPGKQAPHDCDAARCFSLRYALPEPLLQPVLKALLDTLLHSLSHIPFGKLALVFVFADVHGFQRATRRLTQGIQNEIEV